MKKLFVLAFVVVFLCFGASMALTLDKPKESEKVKDIRELMVMLGTSEIGNEIMISLLDNFSQMLPNVPKEVWGEIKAQIKTEEMVELIIPLYDKHFTHDDIKQLLKFYRSDLGKKLVSKTNIITEAAMKLGEQWGYQQGMKAADILKQKGLMPNQIPSNDNK